MTKNENIASILLKAAELLKENVDEKGEKKMSNKRKEVLLLVKSEIRKWDIDGVEMKEYARDINTFITSSGESMILVAEVELSKSNKNDISKNVKSLNNKIDSEFTLSVDYDDEYASIYLSTK